MKLYRIFLKENIDYKKVNPVEILGNVYEEIFKKVNDKQIEFYVRTSAQEQILRSYFLAKEETNEIELNQYVLLMKLKSESDFYNQLEYTNLNNLLTYLEANEQLRFWIVLEPRLNDLFLARADKLKRDAQKSVIGKRKKEVLASLLESYAKDKIYLLSIIFSTDSKDRINQMKKIIPQYVHTHSKKLSFDIKKKFEDKQPRISFYEYHFKFKRKLWITEGQIAKSLYIPVSSEIPIQLSISVALPYAKLDRKDIYLGDDLIYHEKVYLDWTDFQRHSIIFGSTGSGKSNTLEVLAQELSKYGWVVFIDPNSQSARKLSQIVDYYFSITKDTVNFGINPLELPSIFRDRNKNIDYQISKVMQIFDKILQLTETAVNVRYIIQVLLRAMYSVTDKITFKDVYDSVIALKQGTLDLDVNDETFEQEKEMLQQMQIQSFMSILSRLKLLVDNQIFRLVTSETTLDWDKLFSSKKNGLIAFDVGKSAGNEVSELMQMIIVLSLFNYVFLRDALGKEKVPVFIIVDEAQNVAHFDFINEVLAEARKYALHLILATQSFVRLMALAGENNARSINANTNVKILMRLTEGNDIKELTRSVGASEEIAEALPRLSIGQGFLFLLGKTGEYTVPKLIQIRKSELEDKEKELTKGFEPRLQTKGITKETINPALSLIKEPPDVLRQLILYYAFEHQGATITELISALGIKREQALAKISDLEREGAITIQQEGRSKKIYYAKGLFKYKGIIENKEGQKVAFRSLLKLMKQGYIIEQGKQEGEIRPDYVALSYDKTTLRPVYNNLIIIEVESPNEVSVHKEQVRRNMQKYLSLPDAVKSRISEIHFYTSEEAFVTLKEIYDDFMKDQSIPDEYKRKVKIFPVKVREKQEKKVETKSISDNGNKQEQSTIYSPVNQGDNEKQATAFSQDMKNLKEMTETRTIEKQKTEESAIYSPVNQEVEELMVSNAKLQIIRRDGKIYVIVDGKEKEITENKYKYLKTLAKNQDILRVDISSSKIDIVYADGERDEISL